MCASAFEGDPGAWLDALRIELRVRIGVERRADAKPAGPSAGNTIAWACFLSDALIESTSDCSTRTSIPPISMSTREAPARGIRAGWPGAPHTPQNLVLIISNAVRGSVGL